tara:strand:+ start:416 stop:646 length:231 start_codon:yes stop_codon:yes gene_type:complete
MVNSVILACVISLIIAIVSYVVHNKCSEEETNNKTMIKLSVLALVVSVVTYFITRGKTDVITSVNSQEVLLGDPGF